MQVFSNIGKKIILRYLMRNLVRLREKTILREKKEHEGRKTTSQHFLDTFLQKVPADHQTQGNQRQNSPCPQLQSSVNQHAILCHRRQNCRSFPSYRSYLTRVGLPVEKERFTPFPGGFSNFSCITEPLARQPKVGLRSVGDQTIVRPPTGISRLF